LRQASFWMKNHLNGLAQALMMERQSALTHPENGEI